MTFGSLFTGVGGFDLGFERAGLRCAWQVEADPACNDVLARHWPQVERLNDVRSVDTGIAAVDLICGGFPCQDVSVAGRRAGLAGKRSGLWHQFRRIVGEHHPRWVVVENVPGLLSSNEGRDFATIVHGLVKPGYCVGWRVLDAQFFGVAQRRRRVFIVGSLGAGSVAPVLFESASMPGDPAPRRAPREGTAPTLESRTRGGGGGWGTDFACGGGVIANTAPTHDVAPCLQERGGKGVDSDCTQAMVAVSVNQRGEGRERPVHGALNASKSAKQFDGVMVSDPITANEGKTYTHEGRNNFRTRNVVASTLRGNARNNSDAAAEAAMHVESPTGVRRLTPLECERLQGFPDGWTDGQSDTVRYRQLGNAVAVPVALWLASRIVSQTAPQAPR